MWKLFPGSLGSVNGNFHLDLQACINSRPIKFALKLHIEPLLKVSFKSM